MSLPHPVSGPAALDHALNRLEATFTQLEHRVVQWQMAQNEVTQAALVRLDTVLGVLEPLLDAANAQDSRAQDVRA